MEVPQPQAFVPTRNNPYDLLRLISLFKCDDTSLVQIRLNVLLAEMTDAQTAFIVRSTSDPFIVRVDVVGHRSLPDSGCIFVGDSSFLEAVSDQRPFGTQKLSAAHARIVAYLTEKPLVSFLGFPVLDPEDPTNFALACLVNKKCLLPAVAHSSYSYRRPLTFQKAVMRFSEFSKQDILTLQEIFHVCVPILFKCYRCDLEKENRIRIQSLLVLAQKVINKIHKPSQVIREIMMTSQEISKANGCQLYFLDEETDRMVLNCIEGEMYKYYTPGPVAFSLPLDKGIVGHVATSMELVNMKDTNTHPLYMHMLDGLSNIKLRNLLCFPIKFKESTVAVGMLCNKSTGMPFNKADMELVVSISKYCAMCIVFAINWKKSRETRHRMLVANELMIYHLGSTKEEIAKLVADSENYRNLLEVDPEFKSFAYSCRSIPKNKTLPMTMQMFSDLNLLKTWSIPQEIAASFLLYVFKGYRDPAYHNWKHAFCTGHFAFLLLSNLEIMEEWLSKLEMFVFFVGALCHNLDHRGTSNSFQIATDSELAALYCSDGSILEQHHFSHALSILNKDTCNIFNNMDKEQYGEALDVLRNVILSTDSNRFLATFLDVKAMANEGYDPGNKRHHNLLVSLMITACTHCEYSKDWKGVLAETESLFLEYFQQGDLERSKGIVPNSKCDRDKAFIPQLQLNAYDTLYVPVFSVLSQLFPQLEPSFAHIKKNRSLWEHMKDINTEKFDQEKGLQIFKNPGLDLEMNKFI